tara:strand:+ start:590 stop:829 length:240 start_codon:yes stop_codon:yes gene_type:complete
MKDSFDPDDDLDFFPEHSSEEIEWEDLPKELTPDRELVLSVYKKEECTDIIVGLQDIEQFIKQEKQRHANKTTNSSKKR